ncbi:MAG TPA: hypothetical protein VFJ43_17380 [Bacteroidia bacterium]|nr:hypothetical protein [Bacteroidia bacterium]
MITIPNPCPEKWENMSPVAGGAFCDKCSKTVFDFSNSSNEEIIAFLSAEKGKKICGKIRKVQLAESRSFYSKFLAAIAIAFTPVIFASCGNKTDDGNEHAVGDVAWKTDSLALLKVKEDSINNSDTGTIKVNFSKADSIKVADSIKQTKNPIRDFK